MSSAAKAIVPSEWRFARYIAANLRRADYDEALAFHGRDPVEVLEETFAQSDVSWTGLLDGEPVCIFGVVCYDLLETTGRPWFVATDKILRMQKTFLKMSRPYLALMQGKYMRLENWVDERNDASLRWLNWLGARFFESVPCGPDGVPFLRFEIGGNPC